MMRRRIKMWPFNKPKYPPQVLSDKQREVLNYLDNKLVELHQHKPVAGSMLVRYTGVGQMRTLLPVDSITQQLTLEAGDSYIPRSVGLIVDTYGNWVFPYSVRADVGSDGLTTMLFTDILVRTNNSR